MKKAERKHNALVCSLQEIKSRFKGNLTAKVNDKAKQIAESEGEQLMNRSGQ